VIIKVYFYASKTIKLFLNFDYDQTVVCYSDKEEELRSQLTTTT